MDAGVAEERERRGLGKELDIDGGDVANNIVAVVKDGER